MEYVSLPPKTVRPSDHRSKDWPSSYDIRWKHKTSDQYFQEGLRVGHLRRILFTKGAGGRRKSSDSWALQRSAAILTDKITSLHASRKEVQLLQYQWLGYSNCKHNFHLQLSTSSMLIIFFSNFQTAFIYNLYSFLIFIFSLPLI